MSFGRQEEIQRTIAQSSSSSSPSNSLSLPSNNNKIHDNGHLQSTNMSSKNKTKNNNRGFFTFNQT